MRIFIALPFRKAGYKLHPTREMMEYLKDDVMHLCRENGLHQVELNKPAKKRIADKEYQAQKRGQERLDKANEAIKAVGETPKQTKFQTELERMREAIDIARQRAKTAEDFKQILEEEYQLIVTESRGRWSYLPAELSEKIHRGQKENALKCRNNGGSIPLGFVVGSDGVLAIDPLTAPLVTEIFTRYDGGESISKIVADFNRRGLKTSRGSEYRVAGVSKMLKNRKYIGEYKYSDMVIPHGIPAIIEEELFEQVQRRMEANKKAPARAKANEEYLLTTKLFCGNCGRLMAGESGKSCNGTVYHYYKCSGSKRKLGCHKKPVRKHWIEELAVRLTVEKVLREEEISRIADAILELQSKEDTTIPALRSQLRECETAIEHMLDAIQMGIFTSSTKARLEKLEKQREELQVSILQAQLQRPSYTKEQIVYWISRFKYGKADDPEYQRQIIDTFLNSIYVYDDRLVFTYNFKDGTETLNLSDIEAGFSSDLSNDAPPSKPLGFVKNLGGFLFLQVNISTKEQ